MRFVAQKTDGGKNKGKISLYCRVLEVSRQRFYQYLSRQNLPWKYQGLADAMREIHDEDVCNDTYGRVRMRQALLLKQPEGVDIPSERTVYRVMKEIGLVHHPKRKPNGITKANREARKSDDLLKRDFSAEKPLLQVAVRTKSVRTTIGNALSLCYGSIKRSFWTLGLIVTRWRYVLCRQALEQ